VAGVYGGHESSLVCGSCITWWLVKWRRGCGLGCHMVAVQWRRGCGCEDHAVAHGRWLGTLQGGCVVAWSRAVLEGWDKG
jgi:hypothetical protein